MMSDVDDPKNIRDFITDIHKRMKELEEEYPKANPVRQKDIARRLKDARDAMDSNVRRLQDQERL
jgi:Mn-dependent DtxR family transcriptional regulator